MIWLSAVGVGVMVTPSCEYNSYPLEPTFCDDWCLATLRADCKEDRPEACVGRCEYQIDTERCTSELVALQRCYLTSSDSDFSCSPFGISVPKPPTCLQARDEWLSCGAPDVHECVQFCRPLFEPAIEQLDRECPQLFPRASCEDLCWTGVSLDELDARSIVRCLIDVLTRCEPVSRSASQSLRDYCEDAVQAGRYGEAGGTAGGGGGGGGGPM